MEFLKNELLLYSLASWAYIDLTTYIRVPKFLYNVIFTKRTLTKLLITKHTNINTYQFGTLEFSLFGETISKRFNMITSIQLHSNKVLNFPLQHLVNDKSVNFGMMVLDIAASFTKKKKEKNKFLAILARNHV